MEEASIAKNERICRQARAVGRRSRARDRQRLGRLRDPRGAHARLQGHHHDALARAARGGARAGRGRGTARPGRGPARGLPRPARPLRQAGVDRDDRGRRPPVLRRVLPHLRGAARGARADGAAGDPDRRPALRAGAPHGRLHQGVHLPGRLPAVAGRDRAFARQRLRPAPDPLRGHHLPLRAHAAALARALRPEPRGDLGARLLGGVPAHVGVLSLLLRGRLQRAPRIASAQLVLARPGARPAPILGALA